MKIVMLTNAITPDRLGGAYRYVRELSTALAAGGNDVTILTKRVHEADPREEVAADGVRILRSDVPTKQNPLFAILLPLAQARASRTGLRRSPGAVVHAHFPTSAVPLLPSRRPFVYTFHAPVYREILSERQGSYLLPGPTQRPAIAAFRSLETMVVRRASRIVVLSDAMRDEVAWLDPDKGREALLVPGGIDTHRFCPGPVDPDSWADAGSPLLFTARRLVARVGLTELIEAVAVADAALPGTRLAIAGDGAMREELQRRIHDLGLGERVRLLGRVADDELVQWYRRADAVVMPTQQLEGFGLTTAESLACGTPVIATPVAANTEVAGLLGPGFIARDTSGAGIAAAIVDLCGGDRRVLAEAASRAPSVVARFDWSSVAAAYEEVYRSL